MTEMQEEARANEVQSAHKKSAFALKQNIRRLIADHGIERIGVLSTTFLGDDDAAHCPKIMQKRLNSLLSNWLRAEYVEYICIVERGAGKTRRLHQHWIVVMREGVDIRKDFDWDVYDRAGEADKIRDRKRSRELWKELGRTCSPALRKQWAILRKNLARFGFGRHQLTPVKSTEEAVSNYYGKYIGKHVQKRHLEDKGLRLVRYSKGARKAANNRFSWAESARPYREKVGEMAKEIEVSSPQEMTEKLGRHWAWIIMAADDDETMKKYREPVGKWADHVNDDVRKACFPNEGRPLPPRISRKESLAKLVRRVSADIQERKRQRAVEDLRRSYRGLSWLEHTAPDD